MFSFLPSLLGMGGAGMVKKKIYMGGNIFKLMNNVAHNWSIKKKKTKKTKKKKKNVKKISFFFCCVYFMVLLLLSRLASCPP